MYKIIETKYMKAVYYMYYAVSACKLYDLYALYTINKLMYLEEVCTQSKTSKPIISTAYSFIYTYLVPICNTT